VYTATECSAVEFSGDRFYTHKTIRLNYTTYDIRRATDTIHIGTQRCDVMVHAHESNDADEHPFWYARVHIAFDVYVHLPRDERLRHPKGRLMKFLFVRWFGRELGYKGGWVQSKLDRIGFLEGSDAFGFIDPDIAIRVVHLNPALSLGRTAAYLGPSRYRGL
jgi:hypothetical protein